MRLQIILYTDDIVYGGMIANSMIFVDKTNVIFKLFEFH